MPSICRLIQRDGLLSVHCTLLETNDISIYMIAIADFYQIFGGKHASFIHTHPTARSASQVSDFNGCNCQGLKTNEYVNRHL